MVVGNGLQVVTTMHVPENGGSTVTLREVYSLVESVRAELLSELKATKTSIDSLLQAHEADHKSHDDLHERERLAQEIAAERAQEKRSSHIRWAVTTIIAAIGVIVAIYVAFQTRTIQIGEQ